MSALPRIWAIARMTLLEAMRRKVFTILLLFAVALLSSSLFFPSVEIEYRLRLIEVWALRASAIFTAIVGLFLAGFSLPQDFENKRIYMIVSKPVSKSSVFLGRYVGYVLLLAVFIGAMGLITVTFLRAVKLFSGEKFPALAAFPLVHAQSLAAPGGKELEGGVADYAVGFGEDRALVWTFRGLKRSSFQDAVHGQARLIFGAENDPYRTSGTVKARFVGRGGLPHPITLTMNTNEEADLEFPSSIIGDDGTIDVEFRCGDADGIIAASKDWLFIREKSMSFELAYLRGLILILFQSMIVLSLTLMASTVMSAPLSILLGILLYIVGSIYGNIRDGTHEIDQSLAEIRLDGHKHPGPENLPPWVLKVSNTLSKGVLAIVPDFAHFDFSAWLLKDRVVSWNELAGAGGKAAAPILVLTVLGTVLMVFKDFDR